MLPLRDEILKKTEVAQTHWIKTKRMWSLRDKWSVGGQKRTYIIFSNMVVIGDSGQSHFSVWEGQLTATM